MIDDDFDFDDDDFDSWADSELQHMPDEVRQHFIQNGLCVSCNVAASEHRVIPPEEMSSEWTICWTESTGPFDDKYFCINTADHPGRITRDEFEELYG